jgi:hypothetical protein
MVRGANPHQSSNGVLYPRAEINAGEGKPSHHGSHAAGIVHQEIERKSPAAHVLEDTEGSSITRAWHMLENRT